MYINNLDLDNFRCFEKGHVAFSQPDCNDASDLANINLILGNNGTGKTTILQAIALAVLSRAILDSGFKPRNLIRRNGSDSKMGVLEATVALHAQDTASPQTVKTGAAFLREGDFERFFADSNTRLTADNPIWRNLFLNDSPGFLVIGYGASRWVPTTQREIESRLMGNDPLPRYERVVSLFEGHTGLVAPGTWLPRLEDKARFNEVISLINSLLPEGTTMTETMEGHNYCFEQGQACVPFPDLSDGYRAYIGWIADLLFHLNSLCAQDQPLTSLKGIVLIDEVDLHLHPSWQRVILPTISRHLPNLQFIMSSHSPIVAGTLASKNIIFLDTPEHGANTISRLNENIRGLNADQILLSAYFNLESTREPGAYDRLHSLSMRAMAGDEQASREYMDLLIRGQSAEDQDARVS